MEPRDAPGTPVSGAGAAYPSSLPVVRVRDVVGCGLAVVLALGAVACDEQTPETHHQKALGRCATYRQLSFDRTRMVTGSGRRTVVIGDSWSVGRHLPDPSRSWPSVLPGQVHVYGYSGSGFSESAMRRCGHVSFADRAPAAVAGGAGLVVVEGGINDVRRPRKAVRSGFDRLMHILTPYDVVVVGPPVTPMRGTRSDRIDRLLRRWCSRIGVPYISTLDVKLSYMSDGLHPTEEGHQKFGRIVARRIAAVVPSRPSFTRTREQRHPADTALG